MSQGTAASGAEMLPEKAVLRLQESPVHPCLDRCQQPWSPLRRDKREKGAGWGSKQQSFHTRKERREENIALKRNRNPRAPEREQ